MPASHAGHDAEERTHALALARSGAYPDWRAVCRKMLFDGWGVEIFMDADFASRIDRICAEFSVR